MQGTPALPLPAAADGLTLRKSVWTMSGSPADLGNLHQNDRVIIELSGQMANNYAHQMGAIDLLPAGLEIEQTLAADDAKVYGFLDALTDTSMADARDDRFVAAFSIGSSYRGDADKKKPEPQPQFHIAYIARAVTAGTFVLPAGVAEDMYSPGTIGRTTLGSVTVKQ